MRPLLIALALLSMACASLDTVDKKPGREAVSELLVDDLACRNTAEKKCDPGEQPREVRISEFECEALPLRPAARESAHAACRFSGEIIRVNGSLAPLASTYREFSLIELTPGVRVPERTWTISGVRS